MSKAIKERLTGDATGTRAVTRFLRPSERAALIIEPWGASNERLFGRLLPGADTRPRPLPNRLLGLDAAGFPVPVLPIDPVIGIEPPPNLRVAFILERLENHAVAGGGIFDGRMHWDGDGPELVSEELDGPWDMILPVPGEIDVYSAAIYQGLVLNGCQSGLPFPVTLNSSVSSSQNDDEEYGSVQLTDTGTLAHTGFYEFWYEILASTGNRSSRFVASGAVIVHCTHETAL